VDLRSELARRSRDLRFVVGVLALLLAALVTVYWLIQRGGELPSTLVGNRVLLFALRNLNGLLILVILFVIARNLVKLWVERRSRLLGSRFKTKLVATYVGLSLVPVLVLFFYATELLQGAIDRWFSASLSDVLEQGSAVAQALQTTIEERNLADAARMGREIEGLDLSDTDTRAAVRRRLDGWRRASGADLIAVFDEEQFVNAVLDPASGLAEFPELGRGLPREAAQRGRATRVVEPPGSEGRLIVAAAAAPAREGRRPIVVAVGTLLDAATAHRSARLVEAYQSYRQIEIQKGEFKASYLLTFVLVTLLVLLGASWMGLFLARRLVTPLQALGEAFRRVSSGQLDQRIEVPADDEMREVVDSFHRMTDELAKSRAEIERSNRDLAQLARSLDEERARISAILDNLATGVVVLDARGRARSANRAALRMLRLAPGELSGRTLAESFAGDPRAPLAAAVDEAARGAPVEVSFPVGGSWRTFELSVTQPPESGERVVVIDEVTELLRTQKLATWTEAARRVAHEIKNPLTPIRLAAERLLARQKGDEEAPRELVERAAEIVVREVATMQALVDEFARFARMPGPTFAATRLGELVEEVLALYRNLKPGVEVAGTVDPEVGQVWLDREQIRRVLINLLDNAVEATDPPGAIGVSVARQGERVEVAVADSGGGIPPEDRDKLFLPYFSRKGRGSGMGLAIVHRIVVDHDGAIAVEENRPRGTIFRVTLPARRSVESTA
jgi:two-component system nitrogen regulation sensor histidine kinase NtrY